MSNPTVLSPGAANLTEANGGDGIKFIPALLPQPWKFRLTRLSLG